MRAASVLSPAPIQIANLYNETITWPDTTTETITIAPDGSFRLAGVKKKLVGFVFGSPFLESVWNTHEAWHAESHWWWDNDTDTQHYDNLAFIEARLAQLQAYGVRLVRVGFFYTYRSTVALEAAAYRALLDLLAEYKMFVVASVVPKMMRGMNLAQPTSGFAIPAHSDWGDPDGVAWSGSALAGDTLDTWLKRLIPIMAEYPNVVATTCDNELDFYITCSGTTTSDGDADKTTLVSSSLSARNKVCVGRTVAITSGACNTETSTVTSSVGDTITVSPAFSAQIVSGVTFTITQNYSLADAVAHFTYVKGLFKTYAPKIIITHNLCASSTLPTFAAALIPLMDIPSCDIGSDTALGAGVTTMLASFKSTYGVTNCWVNELGKVTDNSDMGAGWVTNALAGSPHAILFCLSKQEAPTGLAFLDADGVWRGVANLLEDNMATWQAPC